MEKKPKRNKFTIYLVGRMCHCIPEIFILELLKKKEAMWIPDHTKQQMLAEVCMYVSAEEKNCRKRVDSPILVYKCQNKGLQ